MVDGHQYHHRAAQNVDRLNALSLAHLVFALPEVGRDFGILFCLAAGLRFAHEILRPRPRRGLIGSVFRADIGAGLDQYLDRGQRSGTDRVA